VAVGAEVAEVVETGVAAAVFQVVAVVLGAVVREEVGDLMKPKEFLNQLRQDEIVSAIRSAEQQTSGEIRVFVSREAVEDPVAVAQAHFVQMGMEKTRERNGVLIFVAPRARKFAVVGDTAVHARCGDEFWRILAEKMSSDFRDSHFTRGIVHAVRTAGDLLARHFPRRPDDRNELPDDVAHD